LKAKSVDLYLHQQGMDTSTRPAACSSKMCGVLAEFERAMIVERVKADPLGRLEMLRTPDQTTQTPTDVSR
jgi:hypothetical protein